MQYVPADPPDLFGRGTGTSHYTVKHDLVNPATQPKRARLQLPNLVSLGVGEERLGFRQVVRAVGVEEGIDRPTGQLHFIELDSR